MGSPGPTRGQGDLADMVEMLLDKGVVVNADIAVSVGDTELLGVQVRAALASFETAAEYGLEFPEGTDMERVEAAAAGRSRREDVDEGATDDGTEGEETARVEVERTANTEGASGSGSTGPHHVAVRPHATTGEREAEAASGDGVDGDEAESDEEADDAAG